MTPVAAQPVVMPVAGANDSAEVQLLADAQAHVVADTITADITGKPAPAGFDGQGGCVIETGSGRAAYGSGNFHGDPAPTVTLHSPARRWHWGKVAFEQRVMRRWL